MREGQDMTNKAWGQYDCLYFLFLPHSLAVATTCNLRQMFYYCFTLCPEKMEPTVFQA